MNGRERLAATLSHEQPDRVCVDFGATFVTGMHVSIVEGLRKALEIDVVGSLARQSLFGTDEFDWKPFTLFNGTEVLVNAVHNIQGNVPIDSVLAMFRAIKGSR